MDALEYGSHFENDRNDTNGNDHTARCCGCTLHALLDVTGNEENVHNVEKGEHTN